MAAFFSPLEDPALWTFSIVEETVPNGMRYAGYKIRCVHASHSPAANVVLPALSLLHQETAVSTEVFVEMQVNPFPIRHIAAAFPWGVPTFYFIFPDATGLGFTNADSGSGGDVLRAATSVKIAMIGQDRITRDPALWANQIIDAITAAGGDATTWQPYATALNTSINSGASAPVLLLDHTGAPLKSGTVDIVFGAPGSETIHTAAVAPADGGDLQKTVDRMNSADPTAMPISNLWSSGTSFRLRPTAFSAEFDFQLARLEDHLEAGDEITVTPQDRHIMFTELHTWLAKQCAIPLGSTASPLQRYSRDNKLTPLVNGPAFFDDLFRRLDPALMSGGGFHLAGWSMFTSTELTKKRNGDPANLPLTLIQAAERISDAGGGCRFLPAKFIQLEPDTSAGNMEIIAFHLIMSGILTLNAFGVNFARTDPAGVIVLFASFVANTLLVSNLISTGGEGLEPNRDAVNSLNSIEDTNSIFSPYPSRVEDNPLAPSLSNFPFNGLFNITRHFGIYHQKFSIVQNIEGYFGYCGGMDLNPNRLDDTNHLKRGPYHDVHALVEGPAVRDLALSFEQRWKRDGGGEPLAFSTPTLTDLGTPGKDIVQIARTYFGPADPSRRLDFAPAGDRTILNSMVKAINAAQEFIYIEDQYFTPPQEYRTALINKVSSGDIRKLIVALPGVNDQPFGDIVRSPFIAALRAADTGGDIVQIGYPRRHYTVAGNDLRTSSGKLILMEDLPASGGLLPAIFLGPVARIPLPPFWVSVEGENMYVYDEESFLPNPDPEKMRIYKILRGDDTRIIRGGSSPKGAKEREHKKGAAATVITLSGIYVHAKMMIVDDVSLTIGSANLNRRGLYHDGEINVFSIPQKLKTDKDNPIAALRRQLWAEMLNLPLEMAEPLLNDPLAAADLFKRSFFAGNRFVDIEASPTPIMFGAAGGDALVGIILETLITTIGAINHQDIFDGVVDPSSATASLICE